MLSEFLRRAIYLFEIVLLSIRGYAVVGDQKYILRGWFRNGLAGAVLTSVQYEEWMDEVLSTIFSMRDGAVIDVGANVGQTLLKVIRVDRERQYIGFEPQISCCHSVDQFISDNNLRNHVILPIGLSESPGVVKLGVNRLNDVTASMIDEYRPQDFYSQYKSIPVESGDNVLQGFGLNSISLLKIDVEGGEFEVIKGLAGSLSKFKPYIIFEVLPNILVSTGVALGRGIIDVREKRHASIQVELNGHGYTIYQIQPDGRMKEIDKLTAAETEVFNYLAIPQEEEEVFCAAYNRR